jgi:N,N'-diacetyllegionaminate synthase
MKLIAEFCQNHNGSFETLQRMIAAAAEGGATHGKIQTIFAGDLSFRPEFEEGRTEADGRTAVIKRPYHPEYERLKGLELSYEQQRRFVEECRAAGLEPLSTAFNITSIAPLRQIGMKSIKVASYDCGSLPLIDALAREFEEVIVSTGATYDEEIIGTNALLRASGRNYSLLHCVTLYPTPLEHMNLSRMNWLREMSPHVGLSEHSLVSRDGVKASLAAIHLGAEIIERHFTILPEDQTRDGKVSITASHLAQLRQFANLSKADQRLYLSEHVPEFDSMMGRSLRPLSHEELLNRAYYRGRFCNKLGERQIFNWEEDAKGLHAHAA